MCVVVSLRPAWRAPVSSTVTQRALASPASRMASFSPWKVVLARAQEGEELPLGDADAQGPQLGQQALGGDLPLDVLHQGEAHDAGTETGATHELSGISARCAVSEEAVQERPEPVHLGLAIS